MNNFDLKEKTVKFSEEIIDLCKELDITPLNRRIIDQLIGSSGSIGANYCEVCESESKKDFRHKMSIAKKEIKETKHWLRLLVKVHNDKKDKCRPLWKEAHELLLIFSKSIEISKKQK